MSSSAGVGELLKKFAGLLSSSSSAGGGVDNRFQSLRDICLGPLKTSREKLAVLNRDEASTILKEIEIELDLKLKIHVEQIFEEEVEGAKIIIAELESVISELQTILDSVKQKLRRAEEATELELQGYEDCRRIVTFLKLKTNVYKFFVSIPFDEEVVDPDPLKNRLKRNHDSFRFEEENFIYLVSRLNTLTAII